MKVFVSWSGDLSRRVAEALRDLFPSVLQGLDMFMSKVDLASGVPWFGDIEHSLANSDFGIIVVTRENQERPWLLFEAGALAKSLEKPRVTPLLVDLANADVRGPLSQFQMRSLRRDDISRLLSDLNDLAGDERRLSEDHFKRAFGKWWDDIEQRFVEAQNAVPVGAAPAHRSERELLVEALSEIRRLSLQVEANANLEAQRLEVLWRNIPAAFSLGGYGSGFSGGGGGPTSSPTGGKGIVGSASENPGPQGPVPQGLGPQGPSGDANKFRKFADTRETPLPLRQDTPPKK
jgi:hypothetical protein